MRFAPYDRPHHVFDPAPYLTALPAIEAALPPGARAFATYSEHYDYLAFRHGPDDHRPPGTPFCTKDLKLRELTVLNPRSGLVVEACFVFPGDSPADDLVIRYESVFGLSIDEAAEVRADRLTVGPCRLGRLLIDELVPVDGGATHFLDFEWGSLAVSFADMTAAWR